MAICVPSRSFQYLDISPFDTNRGFDQQNRGLIGNVLYELQAFLTFTAAGFTSQANGDIQLLRLPPGNIRIRLDLSYLSCPQGSATSKLDVGLAAYTKADGTTQAAQNALLASQLAVGTAAIAQILPGNPAAGSVIVN